MHLLFISNLFPTPTEPERGIFSLQLVKALQQQAEVTVICPLPWFPKSNFFKFCGGYHAIGQVPSHYQIDGVSVIAAKYPLIPKLSEAFHARLVQLGIAKVISRIHQQKKIDVINSHWIYPDSVSVQPIAEKLNIPHVATGLGCDINHDLFDSRKRQQILKLLQSASHITTVSNALKSVCVKEGIPADKISPILNGVDLKKFGLRNKSEARTSLGINRDAKILLYVGRLSEEKNIMRLLAAFRQLKTEQPVELHLVGDGPLKDEIKSFRAKHDLQQRVIMHGNQPHHKIAIYFGAADWFCLPSIREGCPNVVLEALASGKPVMASKVGAIPDLLDSDRGLLFDPLDTDDMANALSQGISMQWQEKRIANSMKANSWESIAQAYIDCYHRLMRSRTS